MIFQEEVDRERRNTVATAQGVSKHSAQVKKHPNSSEAWRNIINTPAT